MTHQSVKGVVLGRTGSTFRVHVPGGERQAVLPGRIKFADTDRVVAGDVVTLEGGGPGPARIVAVEPRRSVLARRAATGEGRTRRAQPIAANVDQVVVVASARDPEPNPRMLDRFLVIATAHALSAVVVVNKIDLDRAAHAPLARRYARAGYPVLATSARNGDGMADLSEVLRDRETVLAGASGVGKSSLLNAIDPGLRLRIGETSQKGHAGRHTTRAAQLIPFRTGGYVVDTPGLREVGAWGVTSDALGACFPEFRPYLDRCRFDDCRHQAEPGCAVLDAVAAGEIDADRLLSYTRILEEISAPSWSSARRRGR
jgi:ribosome biogenesis GTPase